MLSEGSFRGIRKRLVEWLSMARSVAEGVPREYGLISERDFWATGLEVDGRDVQEKKERRIVVWKGPKGTGRKEKASGCGKVGS